MTPGQYRAYRDQALQRLVRGEIGKAEYDELVAAIREQEASPAQAETPTPAYEPGVDTRGAITAPRLAVPARLMAGDVIEKYRLESMQRGGMGEVWKARDTKGERYVALKFLPPELSGNEDEIARIRATFKLVEQLDHPHICRVFDLNEHPRWGWYEVMRWIDGQTLSQYRHELVGVGQPLPWETVVKLLSPAAKALDYAHEQKVLHRDIKPQNVMRDSAGQVVVIDFGLAAEVRASLSRVSRRRESDPAGTRPYLAPEQWEGGPATPKTDQYALGVTAYELLSGRWPFESDDSEILARAVKSKPAPAIDGMADGVLAVLRQALAKQPGERFANCREFIERLAKPGKATARPARKPEPDNIVLGTKAGEVRSFTDQGMKFCWCPAGEFLMGSSDSDGEASPDEQPQRRVTLTSGFWLGQTPVTQKQWERVMGSNPSAFKGRQKPVEQVSWEDVVEFCRKLTTAEQAAGRLPSGWSYRLPTEAEWEYACRAGTTTQYNFGESDAQLGEYAWFDGNSEKATHPVGQKEPNAWRLYDLHGNVWEWCADWYGEYAADVVTDPCGPSTGMRRVNRGGGWGFSAWFCRSAYRDGNAPSDRFIFLGFRVALSPSVASPRSADSEQAKPELRPVVSPPVAQRTVGSTNVVQPGTTAGEVGSFSELGIKFCWCPAGEFLMGSPASDGEAFDDEGPQHRVTLRQGFWLGRTPVTQTQWESVMGSNPSAFKGRQKPVEQVSWEDVVEFCRKLTAAEQAAGRLPSGWSYRLPTEAEWEYACRAGTTTRYSFGESEAQLGETAWFTENSGGTTHPVGEKQPNAWGLYDVHGNVWEWCADWYGGYAAGALTDPRGPSTGLSRVRRGGGWGFSARGCRSADRDWFDPSAGCYFLGFRLALSPPGGSPRPADSEQATPEPRPVVMPPSDQRTADSTIPVQPGTTAGEIRSFADQGIKFCWCPAGSFLMGSPGSEREASSDEGPQHRVTLTQGFWLGQTPVTQEQWGSVMGSNPSSFKGQQNPVENVSWEEVVDFCRKLTAAEQAAGRLPPGWSYRLPTEAEWEYACRAGTTTRYSFGESEVRLGDYAWFGENSGGKTRPLGEKRANAWGLQDLHGNVWEWCADWYNEYATGAVRNPSGPSTGNRRVLRGGCWGNTAWFCRSANRRWRDPSFRSDSQGFRIALSPSGESRTSADPEQAKPEPRPVVSPPVAPRTVDSTNVVQPGTTAGEIRSFSDQGIKFCWCPPGEFLMGSPASDSEASTDEQPQHRVTLTEGFWLGQTPVTQEQWESIMGSNRSLFEGRQNPVENVSWKEAVKYCRKLTAAEQAAGNLPTGWSYRLPTEAEWEYACRAGTTTRYCFGDDGERLAEFAWSVKNSGGRTHPVGDKRANAWGLHDLHGNVWEWCADRYGKYGVDSLTDPQGPSNGWRWLLRGGCCVSTAWNCRSAYRGSDDSKKRGNYLGFRIALGPSGASPRSAD